MPTMTKAGPPEVVNLQLFRSMVRDHLVTLGNESSGLGLKVMGKEDAVVIFPRAGRSLKTFEELLGLTWMEVKVRGDDKNPSFSFDLMEKENVTKFLESIRSVTA